MPEVIANTTSTTAPPDDPVHAAMADATVLRGLAAAARAMIRGKPVDVEEIVQETFLALFKHLKSGKSRQNLPGWVFRVCHNLAVKQAEKARGERSLISSEAPLLSQCTDSALNPEQQMLQAQRRARLQSVLRALPELDRCCVSLRAEGLRYREIAETLGVSLGTVSMSLTRSLAKFERADRE